MTKTLYELLSDEDRWILKKARERIQMLHDACHEQRLELHLLGDQIHSSEPSQNVGRFHKDTHGFCLDERGLRLKVQGKDDDYFFELYDLEVEKENDKK